MTEKPIFMLSHDERAKKISELIEKKREMSKPKVESPKKVISPSHKINKKSKFKKVIKKPKEGDNDWK